MNLDFSIKKESLPEIIANKLESTILKQTIDVENHRLPSEQTLAVSFGVSRPVIREAMKILKARGLVDQKNGDGTFIVEPEPSLIKDTLNRYLCLKKIDANSLFAVRINLEIMAVRLAAENGTEEDFQELQKINDEMQSHKEDLDLRAENDIKFHSKIATISGNPLLEIFIDSIASYLTVLIKDTLVSYGNEDGIISHNKIIEVLRNRNPMEAEDIIREHLITSMRHYELALKLKNSAKTTVEKNA